MLRKICNPVVFLTQHPRHGFIHKKRGNFPLLDRHRHIGIGHVIFFFRVADEPIGILIKYSPGHHTYFPTVKLPDIRDLLLPLCGASDESQAEQNGKAEKNR